MTTYDDQVRASVDLVMVAERAGIDHRAAKRLLEAVLGLEDYGQNLLRTTAEELRAEEARTQAREHRRRAEAQTRIRLMSAVLREGR